MKGGLTVLDRLLETGSTEIQIIIWRTLGA